MVMLHLPRLGCRAHATRPPCCVFVDALPHWCVTCWGGHHAEVQTLHARCMFLGALGPQSAGVPCRRCNHARVRRAFAVGWCVLLDAGAATDHCMMPQWQPLVRGTHFSSQSVRGRPGTHFGTHRAIASCRTCSLSFRA
eukprot:12056365-Alexandrium_andersonii.AAC.1